jgi:hypothetical protein
MHQQLWGYKVEEKLFLGVREQKRLNTTDTEDLQNTKYEGVIVGIDIMFVLSFLKLRAVTQNLSRNTDECAYRHHGIACLPVLILYKK